MNNLSRHCPSLPKFRSPTFHAHHWRQPSSTVLEVENRDLDGGSPQLAIIFPHQPRLATRRLFVFFAGNNGYRLRFSCRLLLSKKDSCTGKHKDRREKGQRIVSIQYIFPDHDLSFRWMYRIFTSHPFHLNECCGLFILGTDFQPAG